MSTEVFERVEKKYLLTKDQYECLMPVIKEHVKEDLYPVSEIHNLYSDTKEDTLIRNSLEKPVYKEKLRIRSYKVPELNDPVYLEIKKKFEGIVYKRRKQVLYKDLKHASEEKDQIQKEINYLTKQYPGIRPAMIIFYHRTSWIGKEEKDLRITFDTQMKMRKQDLSLEKGNYGILLLNENEILMEIKFLNAMPLWLAHLLDHYKIFPISFSKYGKGYLMTQKEEIIYV